MSEEARKLAAAPAETTARAKHLPPRLPLAGAPPDLVPARMINEVLYCERLLYLEWSQGEFADNVFTVDGRAVHTRADKPGGDLPPVPSPSPSVPADAPAAGSTDEAPATDPPAAKKRARRKPAAAAAAADDDDTPAEPPPYQARSVWLSSERLGITAKIDIVEGEQSGRVVPIEYKRGSPPDLPEQAYLPERAQVCAQVLLLREHGYACDAGAIYFATTRQRVPIAVDDTLIAITLAAAARARELAARAKIPPPLVDSPKCNGCSLIGICLPDETNLLRRLDGVSVEDLEPPPPASLDQLTEALDVDPWGLSGTEIPAGLELRRLHPARDDKLPVYVQEQGARVGLDGHQLVITGRKEGRTVARLANTSQVSVLGNVQVTTQALRALLERDIPLSFFSASGYYLGRAMGLSSKNVEIRLAQYQAACDPSRCLQLARGFVATKIRNSRTMLRRNVGESDPVVLSQLEQLAKKAEVAEALASLLGIEGSAARVYFGAFSGMIKGDTDLHATFDMEGRNRRPPKDPINALLSFAYALLTKDFAVALATAGLDPLLGFYHQPRFGRPALALDMMEEFRPIVADSVVIGAVNSGVVTATDFARAGGAVSIKPAGRRRFLLAYERRMDQLVAHPVFGYRISYRRVLEVQARLLGRLLLGELDAYPGFRTR